MPKVLIVDSGRGELQGLVPDLEGRGHRVTVASQGPEVEETARTGAPDLILSTVLIPPPVGYKLSGKVRRHVLAPDVPFGVYSPVHRDGDRLTRILLGEGETAETDGESAPEPKRPTDSVRLDPYASPSASTTEATYTRLLLDNTLDGHILADRDGRILHVNRAYCEMTGYSREELLTMKVRDLEVGFTPSDLAKKIQATVDRGKVRFETRHRAKNGELLDVEVQIAAPKGESRSYVAAFVKDIRPEKRAQLERDHVWDLSADLLAISSFDGMYKDLNPAWTEALGWSVDDLKGRPWMEFVHPDDRQKTMVETLRLRDDRPVLGFTNRYRCVDGTYRVLSWNAVPVVDQDIILAVARDVTDMEDAVEALAERERQLATLFKNLPGVAYRCHNDADWTMELVSDGCLALTGYPTESLLNNRDLSWADMIHPDDRGHVQEDVQRAIEAHRPFQLVYRIISAAGEERWVWEQGELVGDPGSDACRLEGFIADITQRVKAETAEREAREELRALSHKLEEVREEERASIARELHDELGQALTTLRMDLAILRDGLAAGQDDLSTALKAMEAKVDINLEAVQDLSARLRPPVLDVLGVGAALEWLAEDLGRRSSIEFTVSVPSDRLALPRETSVAVFRIAQEALTNVLRHAEATHVSLTLEETDGGLSLVIQDNGVGLKAKQPSDRTSLGLIGMRERAHAQGGTLKVETSKDGGTRVALLVPLPGQTGP